LMGGRRSARALSAIEEMQGRMQAPPPPPRSIEPGIPEAVDAIVRRCLEPDAAKRFQRTVDLDNALARLDEHGKPLPIMRRVSRRTMLAAAALVVLLLGGTYFATKKLWAPEPPHDPVSVVIADFQNTTSDATINNALGQTVRRALEGASFISAYDRSRISSIGVRAPEKLDEAAAREIALKQGLGVVVAGSIAPAGSGYEISAKALQTITGDVIANVKRVASSRDQVLEAVTKVTASIRKVLGDKTSESRQLFAMRSVSTSSLEVVSHYAAAVEAQSRGKFEEAQQSYLKAVELDPKFGLGYQGLATNSRNLDRPDDANKYIKQALQYIDSMTDREKLATRGYYYRLIGDNQQCAKEYGDLIAAYPADSVAHMVRGNCLLKLRQARDAMSEMREGVRILPNLAAYRTNLALATNAAGDFEAAEQEIQAIAEPDWRALRALAYSQVARGLLPEATATYQQVATKGAEGASSASAGLGDMAVYQGRFGDAVRILEEGAAADLEAKSPNRAAIKFTSIAYAHLMAGRNAPAVAAAEEALRTGNSSMAVRFLAARVFVEAGALEKARPLASALSAELPAEPQAHGKLIEGLIALKSGNARGAIKILSDANATLDTWLGHFDLGRAYLAAGALTQADSEFDRCIRRRGEALSLMDDGPTYGYFPLTYYYLGRVREANKTASYADAYREFLRMRGASREDSMVPDARRRAGE
jgi:tetratricopeptide (TPR) repeat protein